MAPIPAHLTRTLLAIRPALAHAGLEQTLANIVAEAHRTWPQVSLDDGVFVVALAEHIPSEAHGAPAFAGVHASDLYLATACAHALPAALEAFDREYLARVDVWLARIDRSPDFVDEVRQRL